MHVLYVSYRLSLCCELSVVYTKYPSSSSHFGIVTFHVASTLQIQQLTTRSYVQTIQHSSTNQDVLDL